MYAKVTNINFPPSMSTEVVSVAQALAPILRQQRRFNVLQVLMDPRAGKGIIVSLWAMEADAEATEADPSYIGQMSMLSSYLQNPLVSKTYEAAVRT
jgi:hypothetical protein